MAGAKYLTLVMGLAVAIAIASIMPWATFADGGSQQEPLSVKQIAKGDVVDHLGYPLGTVVRIAGTWSDWLELARFVGHDRLVLPIVFFHVGGFIEDCEKSIGVHLSKL